MIKNLKEIKNEYIRLRANEQGLCLEVQIIGWIGQEPTTHWTAVKQLGQPHAPETESVAQLITPINDYFTRWVVTPHEIEKSIEQLMVNGRYFQICGRCRNLHPVGLMFDKFSCQSCAEKTKGVVF